MVLLNDYLPFNKKKLKNNLISILKNRSLLDIYDEKTKRIIENTLNYYIKEIENKFSDNHFLNMNINDKFCMHIFKRGRREGEMCCAKIEINSREWLCSRHDRKYNPKHRNYSIERPRCNFIRENGEQCKHMSNKHICYCYIHRKNDLDIKLKNLEKLKKLRKSFFKNKYNKYKKIKSILKNNLLCKYNCKYNKNENKIENNDNVCFNQLYTLLYINIKKRIEKGIT